ncbi:MAG: PAS domain S-box protein [Nodosilinea sp. WJT8-NPBG4]|nr:PAS domain S-box protein [Nodosilinea sp. WJT8-NPBG4]
MLAASVPLRNCTQTATLRQSAQAVAFRVVLSDALRLLTDADEIQATAARILGEHLGASRVIYAEVLPGGKDVIVHKNYTNGVAELIGQYRLDEFGRNLTDDHRTGQPVIVPDVANSLKFTDSEKAMYRAIDIAAYLTVPLIKNDQFVALLTVHQAIPREWTEREVKWVEETAEQTWTTVERARTEAALRESEAKYRTLFESIDQGLCICEMLFDEQGQPNDYRFLEVNSVFEKLTGLEQAAGKRMRELAPNHDAYWFEIYGRVVQTREPVRFENYASALKRWFSVNAFCIGEPQNNQFAVLFTNITEARLVEDERKQVEAALRQSEEHYRRLFESIDEGFCTIEVLFDADDKPFDHRILQANPAFERQSGIANPEGRTASELAPGLEQHWNDLYAQVINTGESIHTEVRSDALDRWFDVLVSRVGDAARRQIAVVFTDISDRKQAEVTLQQTSAELESQVRKFDATLSTITDSVFSFDRDGRFLYANQVLLDLWGITTAEAIGKTMADLNYPADVEQQVLDDLQRVLETGKSVRNEIPYMSPTGVEGYFEYILSPVFAADRTVESVVGLSRDISERKQGEKALRESETQLRFMLDASQIGAWELDLTTEPHTAHRSLRHDQIFGYESLLPKWSYEIFLTHVHPDDRAAVNEKFLETLSASTNWNFECRVIHPNQSIHWIWVRSSIYCDASGTPTRLLGMVVDITDRKQAEATILQREAQFRQLADAMPQQVWITDAEGNTQYVNQQWTAYTGLTLEQTQDIQYAIQVIHPDDFEMTGERWRTALTTETPYQAEFRLKHWTTETYHWFLSRAIAIRDAQGQIVQWFGTSTDIEEFRRAQAEREQLLQQEQIAREAAENANRIKDEFLAVLSHELRSPLNPILGWTQLLQSGKLDAARQINALDTIERNAKLQAQLIEDLLDISRIMQGKLTLTATSVSLAFVIAVAVDTVKLAADAKNIQITLDLDPDVAPVSGDAARLQQVVWNLLTNAIKFTDKGGQVTIQLKQVTNAMAQIRVIDTGMGISPQFLPHVFEHFRQEDGSTTRKFGGLGLGLAIVRQIVELHGGTVKAESRGEQQGATFVVQLPALQPATPILPEQNQLQSASETRLDKVQVLLVDDDTDTREFQTFLLEQHGATVTAVASGIEALQALEQWLPDVIVSDIGMEEMDGYSLMQQIRSRPPAQGCMVPAIALTAYAAEVDQEKALQAGFQTHLAKPLEPERFVKEIITLLKPNRI